MKLVKYVVFQYLTGKVYGKMFEGENTYKFRWNDGEITIVNKPTYEFEKDDFTKEISKEEYLL